MLSPTDIQRIESAVEAAERHTRGEIVVAAVERSSDYLTLRLKLAVAILGAVEIVLAVLDAAGKWRLPPYVAMAVRWGLAAVLLGVASRPRVLRHLLSKRLVTRKVRARAHAKFLEHNVHATREQTGVLILLSELERRVEIVVDRGATRVPQDFWTAQADAIAAGMRAKQPAPALVTAIGAMGEALAKALPPGPDGNPDEIPNRLRR